MKQAGTSRQYFLFYPFSYRFPGLLFICLAACVCQAYGQAHLQKRISISVKKEPLSGVLQQIGTLGDFYFSYNSKHIPEDSLVTLTATASPVRELLDKLVGSKVHYQESGQYIILKKKDITERFAAVTGTVLDGESKDPIDFASVYSKTTLISTITGDDGTFRLRIREKALPLELTISRIGYLDTLVLIGSPGNHQLTILLSQKTVELEEVVVTNQPGFQKFLSRLFVSTRLRVNNLNVGRFFVDFPYQISLSPGLGTHGRMGSQVTNKVSLNLLGGYTAGVDGLEIAGGFNISTHDVQYFQSAGLFNLVYGKMKGVQAAGALNNVIDSLSGVQLAGLSNSNREHVEGVQAAGFLNKAEKTVKGVQIAGFLNRATEVQGAQMSGFINRAKGKLSGAQIGVFNRAKHVNGFQLGIINAADSTDGLSIGLFNFIRKSPSHVSAFSSDLAPVNIAWKTGSYQLYSILTLGANFNSQPYTYNLGMGIGHTAGISKLWKLQAELTTLNFYKDSFENMPGMLRLQVLPQLKVGKRLAFVAGPALNYLYQGQLHSGVPFHRHELNLFKNDRLWVGWTAGVNFYYGRFI